MAVQRFFKGKIPSLYLQLAAVAFGFNAYFRGEGEGSGLEKRHYFLLKLWGVEMLALTFFPVAMEYQFSFLGLKLAYTPRESEKHFSLELNRRIIAILITIVIFVMAIYGVLILPAFVQTLVPIITESFMVMSLSDWMLSNIAYLAVLDTVIFFENMGFLYLDQKDHVFLEYIAPLFSYRIWLFAVMVPVVMYQFYVIPFLVGVAGLINILDAMQTDFGLFVFHWDLLSFQAIVFGYDQLHLLESKYQFVVLKVKAECLNRDYYGQVSSSISGYSQHASANALNI